LNLIEPFINAPSFAANWYIADFPIGSIEELLAELHHEMKYLSLEKPASAKAVVQPLPDNALVAMC